MSATSAVATKLEGIRCTGESFKKVQNVIFSFLMVRESYLVVMVLWAERPLTFQLPPHHICVFTKFSNVRKVLSIKCPYLLRYSPNNRCYPSLWQIVGGFSGMCSFIFFSSLIINLRCFASSSMDQSPPTPHRPGNSETFSKITT